jgi:hypothetical protein
MTPAPHPQPDLFRKYIILEGQLGELELFPYDPVTRKRIFNDVRSRSLESEREKVLDKIIKWCEDGIDALQERQVDGYTFHGDSEKIDLLRYEVKFLEELRSQQGDR